MAWYVLSVATGVFTVLFVMFLVQHPDVGTRAVFLDFRFLLSLACLGAAGAVYMVYWRQHITTAKEDIVHAVIFRSETPINKLARKFRVRKREARLILRQLVQEERLKGEIRDNFFYATLTQEPECAICDKPITMSERFLTCPLCRRPYHKDCLLDYLAQVEERCPKCRRKLNLADIYGE